MNAKQALIASLSAAGSAGAGAGGIYAYSNHSHSTISSGDDNVNEVVDAPSTIPEDQQRTTPFPNTDSACPGKIWGSDLQASDKSAFFANPTPITGDAQTLSWFEQQTLSSACAIVKADYSQKQDNSYIDITEELSGDIKAATGQTEKKILVHTRIFNVTSSDQSKKIGPTLTIQHKFAVLVKETSSGSWKVESGFFYEKQEQTLTSQQLTFKFQDGQVDTPIQHWPSLETNYDQDSGSQNKVLWEFTYGKDLSNPISIQFGSADALKEISFLGKAWSDSDKSSIKSIYKDGVWKPSTITDSLSHNPIVVDSTHQPPSKKQHSCSVVASTGICGKLTEPNGNRQ